MVEFIVEERQNGQYTNRDIKRGTLRAATGPVAPQGSIGSEQGKPQAPTLPPRKEGYVPFDERQQIISTQAAVNTALSFCQLAASQGAVPVAKSAKAADQLSLYRQWVYDEAQRFYKLSTGRDLAIPETAEVALEGAVEKLKKASPKAPPAAEDLADS